MTKSPFAIVDLPRPSAAIPYEPFSPDPASLELPRLRAYVDETGDRGNSPAASPIFGMAAVVVANEAEELARQALRTLRTDFKTPQGRPLSWKDDIKTNQDRRLHAANVLAEVSGLTVIYVLAKKDLLRPGSYRDDVTLFYNSLAFETLRRVLWFANRGLGRRHGVDMLFGHVAKHDSTDTHRYFQIKKGQSSTNLPWDLLTKLAWVSARTYEMSQVADIYGGFLKAAMWPNKWGDVDAGHLLKVWHQIRQVDGCPLTLGLLPRPANEWAQGLSWWPCQCVKCDKYRKMLPGNAQP